VTSPENVVVVPLNCPNCAGPLEVAYDAVPGGELQTIRFTCPYCQTPREFQLPGLTIWVAARQHGEGPETKH
jgi:hypothetical protein